MSIFKNLRIDLKNITSFTYSASAGGHSLSIFGITYICKGLKEPRGGLERPLMKNNRP